MATRTAPNPEPVRETVFLVPNTHCPSCAAFIEELLARLQPPPSSVATSIVSHTVTVRHGPSLRVRNIAKALENAGYEIESIVPEPTEDAPSSSRWRGSARDFRPNLFPWAFGRWGWRKRLDEETKRKRHIEHCKLCSAQQDGDESEAGHGHGASTELHHETKANNPLVVVDQLSSQPDSIFRASISISGMTCSSCVRTIIAALNEKPWVDSANVALLSQSASVEFRGTDADATQLIAIIDELGYEASLEHVDKLSNTESSPNTASDVWKAIVSIEGMTCSSCVGTITEVVQDFDWVQSVDVNLVSNSAMITFEGKSRLDEITAAIEDAGYGANVTEIVPAHPEAKEADKRRSVSIRIDGMHCNLCPGRVADTFNQFVGRVTVDKSASMEDPIIAISYVPEAPSFTIRAILNAISAVDPELRPSIYHPPTIEERARQMHARVQRRIFYRVLLSFIVAVPTFIIGIVYMALVPASNPSRRYLMDSLHGVSRAEWALFILATPVYFLAADHFHRRTIKEIYMMWKPGSPVPMLRRFYRFGSMDMLISLGTTVAYVSSIAELIATATHAGKISSNGNITYFDSVVFLTMFLLIGRLIEAYSRAKAGDAVATLKSLRPEEALLVLPDEERKADGRVETVNVDLIDTSDIVRVVHGGSPPWDGVVFSGTTIFDESSLTGESKPVAKTAGDPVYSGTINKGVPISIEITGVSGDSMLDQIIKVVREGQARRAPIERVADTLTSYFVPFVTLIAITTWLIWLGLGVSGTLPRSWLDVEMGGWPFWSLQFAIAVFIIACPCGIGLATPTALFVGGGLAAKHGILVKGGGDAFQEASRLDVVVFDKTGTLTEGGDPKVTDHQYLLQHDDVWDEKTILAVIKNLEEHSSHPIGKAVVEFCESTSKTATTVKHVEEVAGKGMQGSFDVEDVAYAIEVLAGNEALMADHGIALDSTTCATLDLWKDQAKSVVVVAVKSTHPSADVGGWKPAIILAISDALRPEARSVVESLSHRGLDVWMLSGDNPRTASAVGAMVGIPQEHIIAGVLPQQKADKIKYLQRSQKTKRSRFPFGSRPAHSNQRAIVAMVGDGVNDSPALAVADVGIAIGSGSDVAISSAHFVLVNSNMATLVTLVNLSRAVFRRAKFNFGWALVYNLLALPIAAGVLYPLKSGGAHIRLDPVWASLAMALSSISVVCSSLLLRSGLPVVGFRAEG